MLFCAYDGAVDIADRTTTMASNGRRMILLTWESRGALSNPPVPHRSGRNAWRQTPADSKTAAYAAATAPIHQSFHHAGAVPRYGEPEDEACSEVRPAAPSSLW